MSAPTMKLRGSTRINFYYRESVWVIHVCDEDGVKHEFTTEYEPTLHLFEPAE